MLTLYLFKIKSSEIEKLAYLFVLDTLVSTRPLFSAHNVKYIKGTHLFISTDILKVLICHIKYGYYNNNNNNCP